MKILSSNLEKINDMSIEIIKYIFKERYNIQNFSKDYNNYKIFGINLDHQFTNIGFIKINSKYNYNYNDIDKFSHIYINFIIIIKNLKNLF